MSRSCNRTDVDVVMTKGIAMLHLKIGPSGMYLNGHGGAVCRKFPRGTRIIIFCSTKRMCDQLAWNLNREFGASAIHGDKKQQERDMVLAAFKVSVLPTFSPSSSLKPIEQEVGIMST